MELKSWKKASATTGSLFRSMIASDGQKKSALFERSKKIQQLFLSDEPIVATPASLKTLKVVFFKINDAMISAMELADKIELQIVKK
jgi:hypothetical protein